MNFGQMTKTFWFATALSMTAGNLAVSAQGVASEGSKLILSEGVATPESVYYDPATKLTFFSNVNGSPVEKDGNGYISIVESDARAGARARKLVDGLNAPKGLRARNGVLYVSDIDQLVSIDIAKGQIINKLTIPGAKFLNDTAVDAAGNVYVSDMFADRIYKVANGVAAVFVEGPETEAPNGLLVVGDRLYVAGWGTSLDPATFGVKVPGHLAFYNLKTKKRELVTKQPVGNLDGLEQLPNGAFVVSDWVKGSVMTVSKKGEVKTIIQNLKNPADIGQRGNTLLIPEMSANKIVSHQI